MHKQYSSMRRRTFLTPVWLMGLAALMFLALIGWLISSASTTTVLVMRHASKATMPAEDPGLTVEGEARAAQLAELLGRSPANLRLDVIFVSEFRRTQDTVRPLANRLGVPVIVVPAKDPAVVVERALDDYSGRRILIVGHSNTVPDIVRQLGGSDIPDMADTEFGTLYVVSRPRFGRTSVMRLDLP